MNKKRRRRGRSSKHSFDFTWQKSQGKSGVKQFLHTEYESCNLIFQLRSFGAEFGLIACSSIENYFSLGVISALPESEIYVAEMHNLGWMSIREWGLFKVEWEEVEYNFILLFIDSLNYFGRVFLLFFTYKNNLKISMQLRIVKGKNDFSVGEMFLF